MTTETTTTRQQELDKLFLLLQTQQFIKDQVFPQSFNIGDLNQEECSLWGTYEVPARDNELDSFLEIRIQVMDSILISVERVYSKLVPDTSGQAEIPDFEGDIEFSLDWERVFSIPPECGRLGLLGVFDLLQKEFNG